MESPKTELKGIGQAIRRALDQSGNPAEQIRGGRAALLERVAARNAAGARSAHSAYSANAANAANASRWPLSGRRGRPLAALRAFAALGVAGAAGAVLFGIWMRLPISFQVGSTGVGGHLGDVVEASHDEPVALRFSEGSSIVLGAGARTRVLSAESSGARVLLESGALDVAIVHRARRGTHWSFEAGPFHVLVTGTKFRLDWNPEHQALALTAREGSVLVSGSCLESPRAVKAGENVRWSCLPTAPAAATGSPAGSMVPKTTVATPRITPPRARATLAAAAGTRGDDGWRQLVAAGHLAEGLRAAERADFGQVCRSAGESDLLALADAARLSGHSARAVEALLVLRQRFPHSPDAATAAFSLGRIAFERRGDYPGAIRWFTSYLDEVPQGPLMGDAVGRLMEARQRAGDRRGARADAEQYLRRFPEGPYAPEARVMLSE